MIARTLENKIRKLAKGFPVIAIMGPRQSGKTTLVKKTFPGYQYVSLENPDNRSFAENDPRGFLDTYKKGVILDEVQRTPMLFSYIQTAVDDANKPARFILTGSQNFLLHEKISQTLAGRVAILKLLPLSIAELKNKNIIYADPESYIFKGFHPRLYVQKIRPEDWYPSYIQTYLEKDVRELKNVSSLSLFQKFLKLCASRTGQLLNMSSLALDCGISPNTAKDWLSILEAGFIVFLLRPYYRNFNKRLVKMPKLYFFDTGLLCSLLEINNKKQLKGHYLYGNMFENLTVADFIKNQLHRGLKENAYFWRDKTGHELDLIFEKNGKINSIEIKSGKTVRDEFFKNIEFWKKISGKNAGKSFVIYGGDTDQKRKSAEVIGWNKTTAVLAAKIQQK